MRNRQREAIHQHHHRLLLEMGKYLTTVLLWASLIIGEAHTFFEKSSTKPVNWIWTNPRPMSLQWNVKFVSMEICFLLFALAIVVYKRNRINVTTALTMTIFCSIDIVMYFVNYKVYGFGTVYVLTLLIWIIIYNTYGRRFNTQNRQRTFVEIEH